ncbi:hypothetical protein AB9P05_17355 [Roseivirga sp. BDSF3-8]|uniref:hypothetical protein n=1 Tax=Roseivirga sp. BDSF3-8 TaxID=3241598 RepID=UPI003531E006
MVDTPEGHNGADVLPVQVVNLLEEEARGRLQAMPAALAPFLSAVQVYELHLSSHRPRIDLSVLIANRPRERDAFLRWVCTTEGLYSKGVHTALDNLAHAWVNRPRDFEYMEHLWLEFDIAGHNDNNKYPVPSLVAGFRRGISPEDLFGSIEKLAACLPLDLAKTAPALKRLISEYNVAALGCTFSYMLSRNPGNQCRLLAGAEGAETVKRFTNELPDTELSGKFASLAKRLITAYTGPVRLEFNLGEKGVEADRAIHCFSHLSPHRAIDLLQEVYTAGRLCQDERYSEALSLLQNTKGVEKEGAVVHLLAIKVLYHAENERLSSKAYFRQIANPYQ